MKNNIQIRQANYQDRDNILDFLKKHWNENHIFVHFPELFDYYHKKNEKLSFVIGEDVNTKEIFGVHGFITANTNSHPDIWTVLWKVIPCNYPFLGIALWKAVKDISSCRIIAAVGVNPSTALKIVKGLKQNIGVLDHYYRLADRDKYIVADVKKKEILNIQPEQAELEEINHIEELETKFDFSKLKNQKPYKDLDYIKNRYFNHPINKYKIYGINNGLTMESLIIIKVQEAMGAKVLRIIDFIGNENDLEKIGIHLDKLLNAGDYEYIDFYCHGFNPKTFNKLGFKLKDSLDENIIPNYFEPFVKANIDIYYNTSDDDGFKICKGDSDQDRPNSWEK